MSQQLLYASATRWHICQKLALPVVLALMGVFLVVLYSSTANMFLRVGHATWLWRLLGSADPETPVLLQGVDALMATVGNFTATYFTLKDASLDFYDYYPAGTFSPAYPSVNVSGTNLRAAMFAATATAGFQMALAMTPTASADLRSVHGATQQPAPVTLEISWRAAVPGSHRPHSPLPPTTWMLTPTDAGYVCGLAL
jgi:hypothetical protein